MNIQNDQATPTASPQLIRQLNARRVLDHVWSGEPTTASELMRATGLTRTTVLTLCRGLMEQGWLQVLEDSRKAGQYSKGRPALRYAFQPHASYLVGVDAGRHRVSAAVADLHGTPQGFSQRRTGAPEAGEQELTGDQRRSIITETIDAALQEAGVGPAAVSAVVIGVPAPVDAEGRSPSGENSFWPSMNPQLTTIGAEHGWECIVENDANLAAVAELKDSVAPSSFAVLLSGERMGAGIVLQNTLLRQPRGGAGELRILDLVSSVGTPEGLAWWARRLAHQALVANQYPQSQLHGADPQSLNAMDILSAADEGDALGLHVVDQLGDKLARICAVLAGLLDLDRIVISGAMAPGLTAVIEAAQQQLERYLYAPWLQLSASELGADSVWTGGVRMGIEHVRTHALNSF